MSRRLPIVPTLIVAAAVATMIALGVWQLQRKEWKEALIARYEASLRSDKVAFGDFGKDENAFHRALFYCDRVSEVSSVAGRNASATPGWAHVARCMAGGPDPNASPDAPRMPDYVLEPVDVVLGWSPDSRPVRWTGGEVEGLVASSHKGVGRVIANPPLAGLAANALPDPRDLPNNHLSYAVQWFLFAATALAIYALALRKRWRSEG